MNLAWNEWDPKRKRSAQRRFYVGRVAPDGEDVLISKRFTGGGDVRVPLEALRARAAERAGFEAWLRTLAGGVAAPLRNGCTTIKIRIKIVIMKVADSS